MRYAGHELSKRIKAGTESQVPMRCRDAITNHQRQILNGGECSLTGFKALINSHSSFETSALKDSCKTCRRKSNAC